MPLVLAVAFVGLQGWWQQTRPDAVASLLTIESDAPEAYEIELPTPLLVDDRRDLAAIEAELREPEAGLVRAVDLDDHFLLLARSETCAPYLRPGRLLIDGDEWWVGERPERADITDLYNLCETELVDFHVFAVDRDHLDRFADVTRARFRPR